MSTNQYNKSIHTVGRVVRQAWIDFGIHHNLPTWMLTPYEKLPEDQQKVNEEFGKAIAKNIFNQLNEVDPKNTRILEFSNKWFCLSLFEIGVLTQNAWMHTLASFTFLQDNFSDDYCRYFHELDDWQRSINEFIGSQVISYLMRQVVLRGTGGELLSCKVGYFLPLRMYVNQIEALQDLIEA